MAKVISLQQRRLLFSTGSGSFFLKQLCWGGNQATLCPFLWGKATPETRGMTLQSLSLPMR